MQYVPTSTAVIHADPWNNAGSLGFSTWQRHTSVDLAGGGPDALSRTPRQLRRHTYSRAYNRNQGGLWNIYDRHASFSSNLIARQYRQADSPACANRLIYASFINGRPRYNYHAMQSLSPLLQRKQNPGSAVSPGDSRMSGGMAEHGSINAPSSFAGGPLPSLGFPHGPASGGVESRLTIFAADPEGSRNGRIGSFSSSFFQRKGEPGLAAEHITSRFASSLTAMSSINRSPMGWVETTARKSDMAEFLSPSLHASHVKPTSFAYGDMGSERSLYRAYKRTGVIPARNAEPGSAPNVGMPHADGNLSLELVQRRTGNIHIQPSSGQMSPLNPSVSVSTNLMPCPVASIPANSANVGAMLPSFALRWGQNPNGFSIPDRISRKEIVRDMPGIESALPISSSGQIVPSSGQSHRGTPGFNESFSQAHDHHIHSPGLARYVHRRFTGVSSAKALRLSSVPAMETKATGLAVSHSRQGNSIALIHSAHSPALPVSTSSFSGETPDHFVLQRSAGASRLPAAVEGRSSPDLDSAQSIAIQALPAPMQPAQPGPHTPDKYAQRHEGYEERRLPAIQRLQNETCSFPGYGKEMAHPESPHLFHKGHIGQLPHLSDRMLQKKLLSSLAGGSGLYDRSQSRMERARFSPQIAFDSSLRSYISRRSCVVPLGVQAIRDPVAIPNETPIFHRLHRLPADQFVAFANERTNNLGSVIADRSFSVKTGGTSPNTFSSGFFFVNKQPGITDNAVLRSRVAAQDSGVADIHSTGMGLTRIALHPQPRSLPIGLRRFPATTFSPPPGLDEGASLRPNPIALPRSFHSVMMQAISRSAEPPGLSVRSEKNSLAPEVRAHSHQNFDSGQLQYNWKSGTGGRPLVVLQRAHDSLMRVHSQESVTSEAPSRPEDRYGLVSPPSESRGEPAARAGDANNTSGPGKGEPDPEETVEHIWRIMSERLVIERERRGRATWI